MAAREKNDIQSWVRIEAFSVTIGVRIGWQIAIHPTKKTRRLARFEARELSYPGTSWQVLNLQTQVQIFEN